MNASTAPLSESAMTAAWQARDPSFDGVFFLGVQTTGIFCRPSCPSQPKRENLEFFRSAGDAVRAGYRPCKRCEPELADGQAPPWVAALMSHAATARDEKISADDLRALGVAPERVRRWFQKHRGMTFAAWCRGLRMAHAFSEVRRGEPLDEVILGHGYESHSGFRAAFERAFGQAPGRMRGADCLSVAVLETPLGAMLAAADEQRLRFLEFADRRELERTYAALGRRFALPVVPGENAVLEWLRGELGEYFEGARREFSVPFALGGTAFQERVWSELQRIPFGETASYETIATRLGAPSAVRAVARANATNPIYLLVPCHRVIAKNGTLSGYGGGVWRKRLLVEWERTGKLPR